MQTLWHFAEIAGVLWVGWGIVVLLERDEKAQRNSQDVAQARKQAGRTWWGLWKRVNDAMHDRWWKVSRWSVERRAKGRTKAQVRLHKLIHTNGSK